MSNTRKQQVEDMLDREAIRELPVKYCRCIWQARPDDWAELFAEDGVLIPNPGEEIRGRKNLRDFIAPAEDVIKPRPFIHNHVVELLSDGMARGWCCFEVRAESRNMEWFVCGHYDDEYQKVGGEWKIKRRRINYKNRR